MTVEMEKTERKQDVTISFSLKLISMIRKLWTRHKQIKEFVKRGPSYNHNTSID